MVFSRATTLPKGFGRTILRRAGASSRNRSWRQVGRRGYASDHGHGQQQSSEIPWMIGSAAVTIPAAGWLLQQGPKKSDHSHDSHSEKNETEEKEDDKEGEEVKEEEQPSEEESKEDAQTDTKDEKEDGEGKEDSSDGESKESKSDDSDSEESDESTSKGPGEEQKGERKKTETKGEKDAQGDSSGAKHPYLDDAEKSKKGLGVTETAKIHGTVDPKAPARGVKSSGDTSD